MALKADRIGTERYQQPIGLLAESNILKVGASEGYEGWNLEPSFQRGSVWTLRQKRAWIESILLGIGLPAIFVNRFPTAICPHPKYGWREIVIDGQQRLRATADFMLGKFQVFGERFGEQSLSFQRSFRMHDGMTSVVYCAYETERECAELYLKLLHAGTAHTPAEIKKAEKFIEEAGSA